MVPKAWPWLDWSSAGGGPCQASEAIYIGGFDRAPLFSASPLRSCCTSC